MSIRKRKWTTASGEDREAWIVDYRDADGERHVKTFGRKKDADAYHSKVKVDVEAGVHVAPAKSITVAEAAESWLKACDANGLERSTLKTYREEVRLQIVPMIGSMKLSDVSAAVARKFEDRLRESGRSPQMVRRVVRSLGSLLADAQEQGLAAHNAVRDLRRNRKRGKERQAERRQKGKLKAGVHIPLPVEIKAVLESSGSRWRPLLVTAVFTGLRASELRGLTWAAVDLKANELRPAARRPVRRDRQTKVSRWRAHRPLWSVRGKYASGVEAGLS